MIALSRRFDSREIREIRERAIFVAGKLDPQNRDDSAIAPFALRIAPSVWASLANLAEKASAELLEVEAALHREEHHWRHLGLARRLRRLLVSVRGPTPRDVRFCRFDFHPTSDGWRVSEVNADVPGGFIEAGAVTRIVASYLPGLACPPDPAAALARAIASRVRHGDVALVHATSYSDDQQVMRRLGAELATLGVRAHCAAPVHVRVASGTPRCRLSTNGAAIDAIVRFFPGEWLVNLRAADLRHWARLDGEVSQANPLTALLVQTKRLPLVTSRLGLAMPTWTAILPRVSELGWRRMAPRVVPNGQVLKPAMGRVGEGVCIEGFTQPRALRQYSRLARFFPREWLLQERFESRAVGNEIHACFGVYVIDGKAAGVYARVAPRPLIDGRAQDAAVLLDPALDLGVEQPGAQHVA